VHTGCFANQWLVTLSARARARVCVAIGRLGCGFRRILTVAEEAGDGAIEARRFCIEECKRSGASNLESMSDLLDTRFKTYSTLDELNSVRQLVHTAAKVAAPGKSALSGRFAFVDPYEETERDASGAVDGDLYDGKASALTRSAMREEVRRCTAELQAQASGLKSELQDLVQGCTHNVAKLQSRVDDTIGEFRSADHALSTQISQLDRRIGSTVDPLAAKVGALGTAQRELREELRDRGVAQLEALRQHVEGKLQAHESDVRRMTREMTSKFEEHRRSCDDAVHEVGTHGEISRGQLRQDLRAEIESSRVNQQSELQATALQIKSSSVEKVETLRERWMERDGETVEALGNLQRSVESRLRVLEGQSDGRFAGIRMEMDEKLAAMAAAALDHREKAELQIADAKRQLAAELASTTVRN
jgi:hypothetical protein